MNTLLAALMDHPSVPREPWCPVCGAAGPTTEHHIVPRSQGGYTGPTIYLCGHGTAGCHGMAEDKRLHFRWNDRWEYLFTNEPTKYERALEMDGWWSL